VLNELTEKGMPLEREEDHPHVYWSAPKGWFPSAVLFKSDEIPELLRQLRRVPQGQGRKRLLEIVLSRLPRREAHDSPGAVVPREPSPHEDQYLALVEDSATDRIALFLRYYTASRGDVGERHASVHRVHLGPPARFLAICHRTGTLKTFRVDAIVSARLDTHEAYRSIDAEKLDAYDKASLDGFHDGGTPRPFAFLVRNPDARWVKSNLLQGMKADAVADGIRITISTTALGRLARYVVSLGGAAVPETPALAGEVATLARGALANATAAQPSDPPSDLRTGEQPASDG
jgi:predicted DNA-binding transcriptional regulator YafY